MEKEKRGEHVFSLSPSPFLSLNPLPNLHQYSSNHKPQPTTTLQFHPLSLHVHQLIHNFFFQMTHKPTHTFVTQNLTLIHPFLNHHQPLFLHSLYQLNTQYLI